MNAESVDKLKHSTGVVGAGNINDNNDATMPIIPLGSNAATPSIKVAGGVASNNNNGAGSAVPTAGVKENNTNESLATQTVPQEKEKKVSTGLSTTRTGDLTKINSLSLPQIDKEYVNENSEEDDDIFLEKYWTQVFSQIETGICNDIIKPINSVYSSEKGKAINAGRLTNIMGQKNGTTDADECYKQNIFYNPQNRNNTAWKKAGGKWEEEGGGYVGGKRKEKNEDGEEVEVDKKIGNLKEIAYFIKEYDAKLAEIQKMEGVETKFISSVIGIVDGKEIHGQTPNHMLYRLMGLLDLAKYFLNKEFAAQGIEVQYKYNTDVRSGDDNNSSTITSATDDGETNEEVYKKLENTPMNEWKTDEEKSASIDDVYDSYADVLSDPLFIPFVQIAPKIKSAFADKKEDKLNFDGVNFEEELKTSDKLGENHTFKQAKPESIIEKFVNFAEKFSTPLKDAAAVYAGIQLANSGAYGDELKKIAKTKAGEQYNLDSLFSQDALGSVTSNENEARSQIEKIDNDLELYGKMMGQLGAKNASDLANLDNVNPEYAQKFYSTVAQLNIKKAQLQKVAGELTDDAIKEGLRSAIGMNEDGKLNDNAIKLMTHSKENQNAAAKKVQDAIDNNVYGLLIDQFGENILPKFKAMIPEQDDKDVESVVKLLETGSSQESAYLKYKIAQAIMKKNKDLIGDDLDNQVNIEIMSDEDFEAKKNKLPEGAKKLLSKRNLAKIIKKAKKEGPVSKKEYTEKGKRFSKYSRIIDSLMKTMFLDPAQQELSASLSGLNDVLNDSESSEEQKKEALAGYNEAKKGANNARDAMLAMSYAKASYQQYIEAMSEIKEASYLNKSQQWNLTTSKALAAKLLDKSSKKGTYHVKDLPNVLKDTTKDDEQKMWVLNMGMSELKTGMKLRKIKNKNRVLSALEDNSKTAQGVGVTGGLATIVGDVLGRILKDGKNKENQIKKYRNIAMTVENILYHIVHLPSFPFSNVKAAEDAILNKKISDKGTLSRISDYAYCYALLRAKGINMSSFINAAADLGNVNQRFDQNRANAVKNGTINKLGYQKKRLLSMMMSDAGGYNNKSALEFSDRNVEHMIHKDFSMKYAQKSKELRQAQFEASKAYNDCEMAVQKKNGNLEKHSVKRKFQELKKRYKKVEDIKEEIRALQKLMFSKSQNNSNVFPAVKRLDDGALRSSLSSEKGKEMLESRINHGAFKDRKSKRKRK